MPLAWNNATMAEIVFHAGSKLSWLESIARDRATTAFDLRVAVAISNRTKGDGVARYASQKWIARYIGASEHGVQKSIERLRVLGHLERIRNNLGGGKDGRAAFGGNGHATEYRLLKKETSNGQVGSSTQSPNSETSNSDAVDPQPLGNGPPTAGGPISYLSNKDSLAHVRARAGGVDADQWQAVRQRLAQELGREVFVSWFGKVTLERIEGGVALLKAPSRFTC